MDGREFTDFVRGGVRQPLTSEPNFNRHVGEWIVNDINKSPLDGHGGFTVGIARCREQEDLGWHADIEFDRRRTWLVVFRVVAVTEANRVNPFTTATEFNRNLVRTCGGAFW